MNGELGWSRGRQGEKEYLTFNQYLQDSYVLDTVLGPWDTLANKVEKDFVVMNLTFQWGERDNKQ